MARRMTKIIVIPAGFRRRRRRKSFCRPRMIQQDTDILSVLDLDIPLSGFGHPIVPGPV
jgi:hypothetical protein